MRFSQRFTTFAPLLSTVLLAGVAAILAGRSLLLPENYPYYSFWDMDLHTAVDLLLIKSGIHPDHIHHPGAGMYLIMSWYVHVMQSLQLISRLNLDTLAQALNPIAATAELIDALRFLGAIVPCLIALTCLFQLEFRHRHSQLPIFLATSCIVLSSIFASYSATLIRTEAYALLWWACAVCCAVRAVRMQGGSRIGMQVLHGAALVIALYSKIQVIFLLPIPYLVSLAYHGRSANIGVERHSKSMLLLGIASVLFIIPIALGATVPIRLDPFFQNAQYGPNFTLYGTTLVFLGTAYCVYRRRYLEITSDFVPILFGVALAPWIFCLITPDPTYGFDYFIEMNQSVFWRSIQTQQIRISFEIMTYNWHYVVLLIVAACSYIKSSGTRQSGQLVFCIASLLVIQMFIASRPIFRDLGWIEIPLAMVAGYLIAQSWHGLNLAYRLFNVACLAMALGTNLAGLTTFRDKIAALYNFYGYDTSSIVNPPPQIKAQFQTAILARLQGQRPIQLAPNPLPNYLNRPLVGGPIHAAIQQSIYHRFILKSISSTLPGSHIDWTMIGTANLGAPAAKYSLDTRFKSIPILLTGGWIVDLTDAGKQTRWAYSSRVRDGSISESLYYYSWARTEDILIIPRNDLNSFVFLEQIDFESVSGKPCSTTLLKIEIEAPSHTLVYCGIWVNSGKLVSTKRLRHPAFMVYIHTAQIRSYPFAGMTGW